MKRKALPMFQGPHPHVRKKQRTGTFKFAMEHSKGPVNEEHQKDRRWEARLIPGIDGHRLFGFPNTIITKLRYCAYINMTGTAGARAINVYAANGIFDPDVTGVGHQPMWRDNFANIYDQYVVLGSEIKVAFANTSSTVNMLCGIVGDDDSTISSTVEALMEQNNSVSVLAGTTGSNPVALTASFEPNRDFGVDAKDDGFSATAQGSNPTELWCYGVWLAAADGSSNVTGNIKVEIDYTVKFTELITQGLS